MRIIIIWESLSHMTSNVKNITDRRVHFVGSATNVPLSAIKSQSAYTSSSDPDTDTDTNTGYDNTSLHEQLKGFVQRSAAGP